MLPPFLLALGAAFAPLSPPIQAPASAQPIALADYGLALDLGFLEGLKASKDPQGEKAVEKYWEGTFEGADVSVRFGTIDLAQYRYHEPEDLVAAIRDTLVEDSRGVYLEFEPLRAVRGPYGASPVLAIARATATSDDAQAVGEANILGGLLDKRGWWMRVDSTTLPADARERMARGIEKIVSWKGGLRDPRWTDAEAKAYFDKLAPEDARKKWQKPVRTEHFIVLSPHSSANQYGKKLEAWYAEIKKVLPLEEAKDRRLMPVLLFRHDEEFRDFYVSQYKVQSREDVDFESWCGGDWYSTHFDNDSEYDNRMELTKFLLINRVRAWGACNWFRNGLRELCATRANERSDAVRAVKKKRATPLEKLFDDSAWGARTRRVEKTGVDDEVDYWEQSALWMEFLREGKETKPKFAAFLNGMAGIADDDIPRIQVTLKNVYGWDVPELEKRYAEYCDKRK